jgi:hypothetical protein
MGHVRSCLWEELGLLASISWPPERASWRIMGSCTIPAKPVPGMKKKAINSFMTRRRFPLCSGYLNFDIFSIKPLILLIKLILSSIKSLNIQLYCHDPNFNLFFIYFIFLFLQNKIKIK